MVKGKKVKGAMQGEKILAVGKGPWRVEAAQGSLSLANPRLHRATVLDAGGAAVREIPVSANVQEITVTLPPDAMHFILSSGDGPGVPIKNR
jgi:hypothetical protein